jgi:hypothetical protein
MVEHNDTLSDKALRLRESLNNSVLVGVGGGNIHVYSDKGFKGKVPQIWEEVNVEHHKNTWPRPAKQEQSNG